MKIVPSHMIVSIIELDHQQHCDSSISCSYIILRLGKWEAVEKPIAIWHGLASEIKKPDDTLKLTWKLPVDQPYK